MTKVTKIISSLQGSMELTPTALPATTGKQGSKGTVLVLPKQLNLPEANLNRRGRAYANATIFVLNPTAHPGHNRG